MSKIKVGKHELQVQDNLFAQKKGYERIYYDADSI